MATDVPHTAAGRAREDALHQSTFHAMGRPSLVCRTPFEFHSLCLEHDALLVPEGQVITVFTSPIDDHHSTRLWTSAGDETFRVPGPATLGDVSARWAHRAARHYLDWLANGSQNVYVYAFGPVSRTGHYGFYLCREGEGGGPSIRDDPAIRALLEAYKTMSARMHARADREQPGAWLNLATVTNNSTELKLAVEGARGVLRWRGLWEGNSLPWRSFNGMAALVRMVAGFEVRLRGNQHEYKRVQRE